MRFAIFSFGFSIENRSIIESTLEEFLDSKHQISLYAPLAKFLNISNGDHMLTWSNTSDLVDQRIDFFFSLGGDGTILRSVQKVKDTAIPIVGINLGRMGFLANVAKNDIIQTLKQLESGDYQVQERTLISLLSDIIDFQDNNIALNECTILKTDSSSMITIHAYLNNDYLNTYWCDGLIISTPTGSTAYSLSCGGPILEPGSKSFVITPVAPHTLTVRPLVIPDDMELSFEIEGRSEHYLCTLDSRKAFIDESQRLRIKRASFCASLVRFKESEFIDSLRLKLNWGQDVRNW